MPRLDIHEQKRRQLFLDIVSQILSLSNKQVEELLSQNQQSSLRLNPLKSNGDPSKLVKQIEDLGVTLEPISWAKNAYQIHGQKALVSQSSLFQNGQIYIQNASSLIPPLALDPKPDEQILDMCAAPGGKASYLAELANNQAKLWLNDNSLSRLKEMQAIMEKMGVNVQAYLNHPGQHLDKFIDIKFDKILIDAQCSNEGQINLTNPRSLKLWRLDRKKSLHQLQKSLLRTAGKLLKPDGTIVYSTCTFAPEENECVLSEVLDDKDKQNWRISPINLGIPNLTQVQAQWQGKKLNPQVAQSLRVKPTTFMEGFFVAKITQSQIPIEPT
jgi:tRNA (cytosine49-C5)-methyltransferase